MKYLDLYIYIIIAIKILFILMTFTHLYLKFKGEQNHSALDKKLVFWKERLEFIFILLMSILLIYIFNPRKQRILLIDKEIEILLYLFGYILLITAKWDIFLEK